MLIEKLTKRGPNKKGKTDLHPHRVMNYSQRRPLYLINPPVSNISTRKLPTNGTVLRYFQYVISGKSTRFKSTRNNISCSMARNTSVMICKYSDQPCNEATGKECVLRKIVNIWVSCGFESYIITEQSIKIKFQKLHKQLKNLSKVQTILKKQNNQASTWS